MQNNGIADRVQRECGDLTYRVIGAAMAVHRTLGTSNLEHKRILPPLAVQRCDAYQLRLRTWRQQTKSSFAKSAQSA